MIFEKYLEKAKMKNLPEEMKYWFDFYLFKNKKDNRSSNIFHMIKDSKTFKGMFRFLYKCSKIENFRDKTRELIDSFLDNQMYRGESLEDWSLNRFDVVM